MPVATNQTIRCILSILVFLFTGPRMVMPADGDIPSVLKPAVNRVSLTPEMLQKKINGYIGNRDAAILTDPYNRIIFSKNENLPLIPASILKIITALFALEHLGHDFRFTTRFFMDDHGNLKIKGSGDPLLISEYVDLISRDLSETTTVFNDLVLDASYFESPLVIPGISDSLEPYDSPNGALCVNFNTVNFRQDKNGRYISAEPQTPLLPFVLDRIRPSGLKEGRILLSSEADECTLYAGHLFRHFLHKHGITGGKTIRIGKVDPDKDRLIYTYASANDLKSTIKKMMAYSSNFMANQLLITGAVRIYGNPGSLDKGVKAFQDYINTVLGTSGISVHEGSGISRKNAVTAMSMQKALEVFDPYYALLRKDGNVYYKTGTLQGIRTRAGYIMDDNGGKYKFVILINTPGKTDTSVIKYFTQFVSLQSASSSPLFSSR